MKVGILTFHRALNYGALLQAYALQNFLDSCGMESYIVDYRSDYIEYFYKPVKANPFKDTKTFIRELLYKNKNVGKRKKFDAFINQYIKMTRSLYSYSELIKLNDEFDFFLTGSDQVWNWRWSGFDKTYFLDFSDIGKRYSYAASFGFDTVPDDKKDIYISLLNQFQAISVREKSGVDLIKKLTSRDAVNSIDPTLLISVETWNSIAEKPSENGYVLLYTLENSEELENLAFSLARKYHVEVIRIVDTIRKIGEYKSKGFLSPAEFVGLFANATSVVTNSFHGLMFSCIFEKEFHIAYQKGENAPNARLIDFVREYDLECRVFGSAVYAPEKEVDYKKFQEILDRKRAESKQYFQKICDARRGVTSMFSRECCSGCRACEQVCPKHAICMESDKEGFLYPFVKNELCIQCGRCTSVCVFANHEEYESKRPLRALIAKHTLLDIRERSRSGGVFVAISDYILSKGGVVYGVCLDANFQAFHMRATTRAERNAFCGSKYVQSDTNNTYEQVLTDLRDGLTILFSGTGCQVDGLKKYIMLKAKDKFENQLLTCDIICHGVVSPLIWQNNLAYIRAKYGEDMLSVNFRDKRYGWNTHIETYTYQDKLICSEKYTSVFYEHVALRPSCYHCRYSTIQRTSDITLADAWGVRKKYSEWDDNQGVSFIFLNTESGERLFKNAKNMEYIDVELDDFLQPNMQHPTEIPKNRYDFWDSFFKDGYGSVAEKFEKRYIRIKRKNKIKANIVCIVKKIGAKK